jgi:hypothetical protein
MISIKVKPRFLGDALGEALGDALIDAPIDGDRAPGDRGMVMSGFDMFCSFRSNVAAVPLSASSW